jgi:predicted nucleic acid-binding protein
MATSSKKVYIAADLLVAFTDRSHPKHNQAAAFFRYFSIDEYHLFTDAVSLYEAYSRISADMSPSIAKDLLRTIYMSNVTIYYPDEADMKAALKIYLNDKTGDLTLGKTIMAVIADRKGIPQVATFEYIHAMFGLSVFYIPL